MEGARAPRLGADERITRHFTRVGRFRRVDPAKPRPLPRPGRLLASLAWAVLVTESLRRAHRQVRQEQVR